MKKKKGYMGGGTVKSSVPNKKHRYNRGGKVGLKPTNQGTAQVKGMGAATSGGSFRV